MTDLPSNVAVCGVKGTFAYARLVAGDADGVMDLVPVVGLVVTLTASPTYLLNATATPKALVIVPEPLALVTDSNGDLRDVDGNATAYVIASDDVDLNPHDWTYTVSFSGPGSDKFRAYSAAMPGGTTVDISLITPIPSALGISVSVAQAAEAAAAAYATAAAADAATAAAGASTVTTYAAPKTARYLAGTNTGDEASAIQAVLDAAGADEIVRLYGTFATASTITVKGNLDASGCVINYSGSGVAVQIGDSTVRFWKQVICPRVVNVNKSGTGWASVAGSVGIKMVNLHAYPMIVVPHVKDFETGLLMYGQNQGVVFNNIYLGHLDNNKVNQKVDATSTGWVNQNTFTGGEFGHNSGEGTNVSGVRHLELTTGLTSVPNNNTWTGSSFEGDTSEWHLNVAGQNNLFENCRYEVTGGARVRWQADAVHNQIVYGYKSDSLVETTVAGALRNHILSQNKWKIATGSGATFENTASGTSASITVMDAGGIASGAAPTTAYALKLAATSVGMKAPADAFDRIQFNPANSRLYFGSGSVAPVRFFASKGSTAISMGGGDYVPDADNTQDNGIPSLRWRYIRAGTAVQTGAFATGSRPAAATAGVGAMVWDSTLGKPIWSTGSAWVDATGATV